jgi:Zn-dependent protease
MCVCGCVYTYIHTYIHTYAVRGMLNWFQGLVVLNEIRVAVCLQSRIYKCLLILIGPFVVGSFKLQRTNCSHSFINDYPNCLNSTLWQPIPFGRWRCVAVMYTFVNLLVGLTTNNFCTRTDIHCCSVRKCTIVPSMQDRSHRSHYENSLIFVDPKCKLNQHKMNLIPK